MTTVGTAVYRASLERSRERVRALARITRPLPVPREEPRNEHSHPVATNARLGEQPAGEEPTGEQPTHSTDRGPRPWDRYRRFARLRWGVVGVGALGAFVLAMMVITGFEWASGETLGGNGAGTTIGRAVEAPPEPRDPAVPPAPPSSSVPTSSEPPDASSSPTATTTPDSGADNESPSKTSDRPAPSKVRPPVPSEVTPTRPLIPTRLPGPVG